MCKPLVAVVLVLSLTACGGGGSTSTPGASALQSAQSAQALASGVLPASSGTVAAGYVECDNAANITAGNDCNGYANFSDDAFAFTAIAATASGAPIAEQLVNGSALGFANGSYRVVESPNDVPPLLSISGGPWSAPGAVLSGASGSFGNRFFVRCLRRGTGTLQLELVSGVAGSALPFATSAFATNNTTVNCSASGSIGII